MSDVFDDVDISGDMGPIDCLVIEFPGNRMTGGGLPLLLDLADRGLIRILDQTFIRKDTDGSVTGLEIGDLTGDMTSKIEQLKQLGELKTQGVLTEAEFEEQKRRLLDS
ncbi:SHOCT domain-containing protein [Streptomyces sp. NPDC102259]|uniref:SHOCT domain-containing protein n=1 Tax=Streptomyces sp. NPDC102259 TaxID=3366148 RepID=UPI0037F827CD